MQLRLPKIKKTVSSEKRTVGNGYSLALAIFSVFSAMILWFFVQEAEAPDYKKTFSSIPVEMQSLSSLYSVIEGGQNTVDITLVGKRSDLNKIKASDLQAYLDLSTIYQSGNYEPEISVMVPEGTELASCFPQKANLFIDETVSHSVPVLVEMGTYSIGDNMSVEARSAVESITVKGPKTIVSQIDCAKVKTGEMGDVVSSFEKNLNYSLLDKNGAEFSSRHVIQPEANVRVVFTVLKTKTVPLTVESKNGWWQEDVMRYTVSPQKVIIKGEPALVDAVTQIPAAVVDEKTVDSSRYKVTVAPSQLLFPAGIELGETLGDITVNVSLSDNTSRTLRMKLDSTHVVVTPPENALTYQILSDTLSFKVRGKYADILKATTNDFYLNIDLSEQASAGEVEVPVEIIQTSATEGKFYPVGTYTVKVLLQ